MPFVSWQGAGGFKALIYLSSLLLVNMRLMLDYDPSLFRSVNWWLPTLISAAFNS